MNDLVGQMMDYEEGLMEEEDMIQFFQQLINSGMVNTLQGSYGRTANSLIESGHCQPPQDHE